MLMAEMFADDISADSLSQMHRHRRKYARYLKGQRQAAPAMSHANRFEKIS